MIADSVARRILRERGAEEERRDHDQRDSMGDFLSDVVTFTTIVKDQEIRRAVPTLVHRHVPGREADAWLR